MEFRPESTDGMPDWTTLRERLERLGVSMTPSTPEGRKAVVSRALPHIPGVLLSQVVVEMRNEEQAEG